MLATHIDTVKQWEEEPVSFGPTSLLVDYGSDWKLHTAVESNGNKGVVDIGRERVPKAYTHAAGDISPYSRGRESTVWGVSLMIGYLGFGALPSCKRNTLEEIIYLPF